ncbi:MAG: daunorubicin ABC transporter ATP-binding protein [Cuniculiplasma sp. C_DKE]|uniref:ABC transporter permease n=1 Tax=Cuniculiplasma divulgatum TaxID=1673428 RepID=A0A1N5WMP5_9ARCH|nr:MAG: daunorubicin resistance ATP-binding protein DrrB [Thermoplasmatales archaeon Gpl]OWP55714.1 MAG: daunorubicin ABC transporter ATP-binding protein [Cuniculiplasma sp. C_DKE]SIM86581.1 ABC transporter permease [Cuniculiplasma divulgatum]SJK85623.1 ABC transporter permease [Cuniculiplasma divulgatum]
MNLKFIFTFAWYYGVKVIVRGPSYIIASLVTPLTLLFVVYVLTQGALVQYAVVGGMITLIASIGLQSAGDATFMRLQLRIQEMYVASEVTPIDYMLSMTLSFLAFSIPGIVVYSFLGSYYHLYNIFTALYMLFLIFILILSTSAISFIISSLVNHVRNIWGITSILSIVMTVIPPTFYPYTYLLGKFGQNGLIYALSLSPATPAAVSAQIFFGLEPWNYNEFITMVIIMLIETIVYFAIAKYLTRWREH